jgi:hypothetical protein
MKVVRRKKNTGEEQETQKVVRNKIRKKKKA